MAYSDQTTGLLQIAEQNGSLVDDALEAGAAEIDAAFGAGGYVTPLEPGDLSEPAATRWSANLAVLNRALAARTLSHGGAATGPRGQPAGVAKDHELAQRFLKRIRRGELVAPFPRVAGQSGICIAGSPAFDADDVDLAQLVRGSAELIGGSDSEIPI